MTRRRYRLAWAAAAALAVFAVLALGACGDDDGEDLPENPDIRGTITSVTEDGGDVLGTVLIEGVIEDDTSYDKASVRVEDDTEIFQEAEDGSLAEVTFAELHVGLQVEAWFTGPVAESYPVQAKAAKIVILADQFAGEPSPTP
jgi:beta-N-acetylhexosaminidase